MAKNTQRASDLLASVTQEILGGSVGQQFGDNAVRVENLLLEMVRPDPVQPRRVLPERIHFSFHNSRLTPTQALRELVQIAQIAARQKGHPFTDVMDMLPKADDDQEPEAAELAPEERLVRDLVNLAITIRDDGQVNPLTVVNMTEGVTRLYRIETGERRYWATWLLRDFIANSSSDGTIPCIVIPRERASPFRQAKENTARSGLSAIAMARQAALLMLAAFGYEIPKTAVETISIGRPLNLTLHSKREYSEAILTAMGGIGKDALQPGYEAFCTYQTKRWSLQIATILMKMKLRYVTALPTDAQAEIVRQIIDQTNQQTSSGNLRKRRPRRRSTRIQRVKYLPRRSV